MSDIPNEWNHIRSSQIERLREQERRELTGVDSMIERAKIKDKYWRERQKWNSPNPAETCNDDECLMCGS